MLTNCHVFSDVPQFCVRGVTLSETDDPETLREKFARVIVDNMYQFVGLLDVNGMILEINRAAVESFGIRMDQVRGTPFWDADKAYQILPVMRSVILRMIGAANTTTGSIAAQDSSHNLAQCIIKFPVSKDEKLAIQAVIPVVKQD